MSHVSADEFQDMIQLPTHVFFYTLDQVAYMLNCNETYLRKDVLYYTGVEYGMRHYSRLRATNIAGSDAPPEWRVSEEDFLAWLRGRGITFQATVRPSRTSRPNKRRGK